MKATANLSEKQFPLLNGDSRTFNILFFLVFALVILFRVPEIIMHPRFWAEEASVYFLDAYTHGAYALLHSHQGYYSIVPTLSTWLASLVPLAHAPTITTFVSYLVQLLPVYIVFSSRSVHLNSVLKKTIASMVIVTVGMTGELHLNTINSQFTFVVITFLILLECKENISTSKTILFLLLILFSGLSGIPGNILAPFFLLQYFTNKENKNLYLFIILSFTTMIQILFILYSDGPDRTQVPSLNFIKNVYLSLFQYPILPILKFRIYSFLSIPILYIIYKYLLKERFYRMLYGAAFIIVFLSILGSLGMNGGSRYIYASSVISVLGFLFAGFDKKLPEKIRHALLFFVLISITNSLYQFYTKIYKFDGESWPKWSKEVVRYQNHEIESLAIYPQWKNAKWSVTLPRK